MRKLLNYVTTEVIKAAFAGEFGHKWWATNTVYLENHLPCTDDEAETLYNQKAYVYIHAGEDLSGETLSDKYEVKSLESKLFMADNNFAVRNYVESISCLGETTTVVVMEEKHWAKAEVHQMRVRLSHIKQRNKLKDQFTEDETERNRADEFYRKCHAAANPFWEIHDKFTTDGNKDKPQKNDSNLQNYSLPLVNKVFPEIFAKRLKVFHPSTGAQFANRYLRRRKKHK